MRSAHQLGGAAEFGARAGRGYLRHRLAAPHQRAGIGLDAGAGFDRHGFAGEHGLVEQDFSAGEFHVGGDHGAEGKLHHVARHQFGRGHGLPGAVAPDGCVQSEPRLQRGKGRLGAAFLEQPEHGVEDQQPGNDRALDIFAERQFEHHRRLEHPRHRRPEFFDRHAQRMQRRIGHRVRAEFFQPTARFVARQAARQIVIRRRRRFRGRRACIRSCVSHALKGQQTPNDLLGAGRAAPAVSWGRDLQRLRAGPSAAGRSLRISPSARRTAWRRSR